MLKRFLLAAALCFSILLGGGGCMRADTARNNRQNINDVALNHLERKYGGKFEYNSPWGNSMSGTRSFLVTCDSLPEKQILVQIENFQNDDFEIRDNYLAVKYELETIDYLSSIANQVFGEAIVFYDLAFQTLSADLNATASFHEYLADTRVPLHIMFEVKLSGFSSKDQALLLADLIASNGSYFRISLVVVSDDIYGSHDSVSLEKLMAQDGFEHCAKIDRLDGNIEIRWLGEE